MLNVWCVRTGDKYPEEYVYTLKAMVARHLHVPHNFYCLSDNPIIGVRWKRATLPGWWAKLHLFEFAEPLIYFDLDVVITGDLQPLVDWDGFGIIRDCDMGSKRPSPDAAVTVTPMFNSSVMKLTGNERHVWDEFKPCVMDRFSRGGDQRWITARMPDAKTFPPEWFVSYKWCGCESRVPDGALAVIFHGEPKPSQILDGWVPQLWRSDV